jgi:hypothetical protein
MVVFVLVLVLHRMVNSGVTGKVYCRIQVSPANLLTCGVAAGINLCHTEVAMRLLSAARVYE